MTKPEVGDVVLANWGSGYTECVVEDVDTWHANDGDHTLLYGYWRRCACGRVGSFCREPAWTMLDCFEPHPHPAAVRAALVKQLVREAAGGGGRP
jgi:hypothetical protein